MTFSSDLDTFAKKANSKQEAVVRKVVLDVGTRLVQRSPVGDADYWQSPPPPGYVGGRFRANWQYAFNQIPVGVSSDIDASGGKTISNITAKLFQSPAVGIHYLSNNLPYAQKLENGWSRQAPSGMVGLTVVEFQSLFKRAVKG